MNSLQIKKSVRKEMSVGSAILMWAYILSKPLDANDFRVNEVMTLRIDRYKKKYCKKSIQFFLAIDSEPSKPLSLQIQCTASAIKGFPMHADRSMVRENSIEKSKLRDLLLCKTHDKKRPSDRKVRFLQIWLSHMRLVVGWRTVDR